VILKEKLVTESNDARLRAGDAAEKQMAFYLQREFRKRDDCFVINDLRVIHDGDAAQIDHLIVSNVGLFIVESKSVHGTIAINAHGDWQRSYNGEFTGMPSPVLQAEAQGKILKELLRENAELVLGKMLFGKLQKGFKYCPVCIHIAISDSGIIERGMEVPELFKADAVAASVAKKITHYKSLAQVLSPKGMFTLEGGWEISKQEAQAAAEFLLARHVPLVSPVKQITVVPNSTLQPVLTTELVKSFIPTAGAICPSCGELKLIRKSIKRSDLSETDFLACENYPSSCKTLYPLVAMAKSLVARVVKEEKIVAREGQPCPKCHTGSLVKRQGKYGKPDFYGCSTFGKTKCGFIETIATES
jgi:ssDNA-binding Zn-finger/Zn-ribbon topoisomerase 1